jgi:hypothetical protein
MKQYLGLCHFDHINRLITLSVLTLRHRCTQVENPGVPDVFAKIPRGGQGLQEKLPGGLPILGFIAFLLTSVLKFS